MLLFVFMINHNTFFGGKNRLVLIFALLTLFNMYDRIVKWLRIRKFFYDEVSSNEEAQVDEGRQIITQGG